MPVEFEDVEFRDFAETGRHLGVCSDDPEKAAWVAHASAAGLASNLSQLMNTAPVRDTVPDVSSSAAEPVTYVEHMDDDDDDDDRPPGKVLPSDSPHVLEPSHSAPEHASQQTRTRSLIFRRCALVQNAQSRMRTTIIRSTKSLKRRRSAIIFTLPQLFPRTNQRWMTRATRLIGINCRTKSFSPIWKS
jgi:hypothetical protein